MAQSGYTPILIYASGTTGNTPSAANLTSSSTGAELALNYYDGKLFYKDASGNVQLLASKATSVNVSSLSFGTTGLTPNTASTGAITVAGTLITSNGGTGLSSYTAGDLPYYASGTALSKLAIGASNYILSSSGTAPQWVNSINIGSGTFTSVTDSGLTSGRVTYAGTSGLLQDSSNLTFNGTTLTANTLNLTNALGVAYGGTGLTSLTSGYIPYGNGTGAFSSSSNINTDGTNLGIGTSTYNIFGRPSSTAITLNGSVNAFLQINGATGNNAEIDLGINSVRQASIYTDATTLTFVTNTNIPITWNPNQSEKMRLTTAGYLGIGTSSPTHLLEVYGTSGNQYICSTGTTNSSGFQATNSGQQFYFALDNSTGSVFGSAYSGNIYGTGAYPLQFWTNTTKQMTLDTSGNLGLGVTPSAWVGGDTIFQIKSGSSYASLWGRNGTLRTIANAYFDGTNYKYASSSYAPALFQIADGSNLQPFQWNIAPTGTAGNNVTFTQAMTLDNSGNFIVGQTSTALNNGGFAVLPAGNGANNPFVNLGHISGSASGSFYYLFQYSGTTIGSITQSGTTGVLYNTTSDQRLKTNIIDAPSGNIDQIKVRSFDWIADNSHQTYGMVAQELVEVAPYAVHQPTNPDEMMGVDYSKLVPMMIKEIQDLKAEVNQLKQKLGA